MKQFLQTFHSILFYYYFLVVLILWHNCSDFPTFEGTSIDMKQENMMKAERRREISDLPVATAREPVTE